MNKQEFEEYKLKHYPLESKEFWRLVKINLTISIVLFVVTLSLLVHTIFT